MDLKQRKAEQDAYADSVCASAAARKRALHALRGYARLIRLTDHPLEDIWSRLSMSADLVSDAVAHGIKIPDDGRALTAVKVSGVELKRAFRLFIERRHGSRCCYCQRPLQNIAYAKPIEHIVPKSSHPRFSLDFWNLAVSCYDCNQYKAAKDWTGGRFIGQKRYPLPRAFHDVFHARYHAFDSHVAYVRLQTNHASVTYFVGKTPQGDQLCRDHLAEMARREMLWANNAGASHSQSVIRAFGESVGQEGRDAFWAFYEKLTEISTREE